MKGRLLVFTIILASIPAFGQQLPLTGLSNAGLVAEVTNQLPERQKLRRELDARMVDELGQLHALGKLEESLASLLAPSTAPSAPGPVWERVEAEHLWSGQRIADLNLALAQLQAQSELLVARQALVAEEIVLAAHIFAEHEGLQPFIEEIDRRVEAGRLNQDEIPVELSELRQAVQTLQEHTFPAWQAAQGELNSEIEKKPARILEVKALLNAQTEQHSRLQIRRGEAQLRKGLYASVNTRDPQSLLALITRRLEALQEKATKQPVGPEVLDQRIKSLEDQDRRLRGLTMPLADTIQVGLGLESWRKAKRALLIAEARLDYHKSRELILTELIAQLEPLLVDLELLKTHTDGLFQQSLEIDVLRGVLFEVQDAIPDSMHVTVPVLAEAETLSTSLQRLTGDRSLVGQRIATRGGQLEAARGAFAANVELMKELQAELPGLKAAFQREDSWAAWSRELRGLDNGALTERFGEEVAQFGQLQERIAALALSSQQADATERAAWQRLGENSDPLVRSVQLALSEHRSDILDSLATGTALPPLPHWPQNGTSTPDKEFEDATLLESLELQRNSFMARLRHHAERESLVEAVLIALLNRVDAWEELRATTERALESSRRVYGAASAIELRQWQGSLPRDMIPPTIGEYLDREEVASLEIDLRRVAAEVSRARSRLELTTEREATGRVLWDSVQARLDLTLRRLDTFRLLGELQLLAQPTRSGEVEERRHRQKVLQRMQLDEPWHEPIMAFFNSEQSEDLVLLLEDDYTELVDLELLGENIENRDGKLRRLIQLIRQEQELLADLEPRVEGKSLQMSAEEALLSLWARWRLARDPAGKELLQAQFQQESAQNPSVGMLARSLPSAAETLEPGALDTTLAFATDLVFSYRCELLAYRDWLEQLRRARGRQGRLGRLERGVANLQDRQSALEAEGAERLKLVKLLTGHSVAELQKLDAEDRPTAEAELQQYLRGSIGWTRKQLLSERMARALRTALLLLLVPVAAWLVIQASNRLARRYLARYQRPTSAEQPVDKARRLKENEERVTTVMHNFRKAFSVVVTIVAGIYILQVLRVDVTPILASAGILGLAVAFGAQSLMKDLFAGFFILLENQYKLGDFIKINDGTGGEVEGVSLRLTTIRDREGVLHFIPNGCVTLVSNMTRDYGNCVLIIGVSYEHGPDAVIACLCKVGDEVRADPVLARKVLDYEVSGLESFGDSSVNFRISIKTVAGEQWQVSREVRRRIKIAFDRDGITIPFPQRVVYHKYPDGLQGRALPTEGG